MSNKSALTVQDILQSAEEYLAQIEAYEDVTMQQLANFLGVGIQIVYRRLPFPEWMQMQHMWILNRLRRTAEVFRINNGTQEDLKLESIAKQAGIPLNAISRFLTEDEWRPLLTTSQENTSQNASSLSTYFIDQAKQYLAQAEKYNMVEIKHFAAFLEVPVRRVWRHLPTYQWEMLRNAWIQDRLRQAMDDVYAAAKTQEDFTVKQIAKFAEMPYRTVLGFLNEDVWQACRATLPKSQKTSETISRYVQQAENYLAQTLCYEDITVQRFATFLGVKPKTVSKRLSNRQWEHLRNRWIENRLKLAMDTVFAEAKTPGDITIASIAKHAGIPSTTAKYHLPKDELQAHQSKVALKETSSLQQLRRAMDKVYAESKTQEDFTVSKLVQLTGIPHTTIDYFIKDEWWSRRNTLPTKKEKVLMALETLVGMDISVKDLTRQRVIEVADVNGSGRWPWFNQPFHAARRKLALRPTKQISAPPSNANVRIIPGGWVDINEQVWDLRPMGLGLLQKNQLRSDLADIAWSLLRNELESPDVALGTIDNHYYGFASLGTFFRNEVTNVRQATLAAVQRLWLNYQGADSRRQLMRQCLVQIFEVLVRLARHDNTINATEMFNISTWLQTTVKIGRTALGENFLLEGELNAVLHGCFTDITAGITYINAQPDMLTISVHPLARENATMVVNWAVALMILVMAFTGLRRESVLRLKIGDWAEVHPELFVLAWRHNKKGEENVAVLPATLAQLLQIYIRYTSPIRVALQTEYVFLMNNSQGHWRTLPTSQFSYRLKKFVERHHLNRNDLPLSLTSTDLRRTYATRSLYEGRDIAALRAQLGHSHFESTLRYVKFDRFEHPAEVSAPLDEYGRKALVFWQKPLILADLNVDERMSLLSAKVKHEQDVGLCRHEQCMKAVQGNPPPCSLCEHLVTGPEFLDAWQAEGILRKRDIEQLAKEPELGVVLAQMKSQFERFEANFACVQERIHV